MDASSNMTASGMSMSMDTTNDQSLCTHSNNLPSTPQRFSTVKTSVVVWNLEEARSNLRNATQILSKYGLKLASKWAAEQLNSLAPPKQQGGSSSSSSNVASSDLHSTFLKSGNDLEYYAKSVMDVGDYHRAAFILSMNPYDYNGAGTLATGKKRIGTNSGDLMIHPPRDSLTSYGLYLRAYSLYMAGERRKEEEVLELRDPLERTAMRNRNLQQLFNELQDSHRKSHLDAFGMYIYGVVLKEMQKSPALKHTLSTSSSSNSPRSTIVNSNIPPAHIMLAKSVMAFQYNWSAWLDLAELCIVDPVVEQEVEYLLKPISSHWMYHFFRNHVLMENQKEKEAIMVIESLIDGNDEFYPGFFVSSNYLLSQLAVAYYEMRDFDTAQEYFQLLEERDPQSLDQMDVYSNILFVKGDKVALSVLAHRAMKLDKYRVETCCIVGNYYSSKSQHQKAVQYFQRALKLDRNYRNAWTLMGHEYMEMQNTAAAIEAYRRAVDINSKDYKAWYGLGQTYEIMNMPLYALFYFKKGAELKPHDARMWCAMGECYLSLERNGDAIKCFERAVANNDVEGVATMQLANLCVEDGDNEKAARCYLRHLELRYQAQLAFSKTGASAEGAKLVQTIISSVNVDEPEAKGLLFLAYYYRDHGEYNMATLCCSRLLDYPGPEKEDGKALQREIRSIVDRKGSAIGSTRRDDTFEFSP